MNCLGADEFQCGSLHVSTCPVAPADGTGAVTKKERLNENKN